MTNDQYVNTSYNRGEWAGDLSMAWVVTSDQEPYNYYI